MNLFSWPENLIERPVTIQSGTLGKGGGFVTHIRGCSTFQGGRCTNIQIPPHFSLPEDLSWPISIIHVSNVQDSNAVKIKKNQTERFQSLPVIRKRLLKHMVTTQPAKYQYCFSNTSSSTLFTADSVVGSVVASTSYRSFKASEFVSLESLFKSQLAAVC